MFKDKECDGCEVYYGVNRTKWTRIKHEVLCSEVKINGRCKFFEKTGRYPEPSDITISLKTMYGAGIDLAPSVVSQTDHRGDQDNVYLWKVRMRKV